MCYRWKQPTVPPMNDQSPDKVLRKPSVESITGFTERQLRDMERKGHFPKRFLLNPDNGRAVGWLASEVADWVRRRAASRDAA